MHLFQQVKEQLHLQDVAERYTAQTARQGKLLCPFHDDKHPSMQLKNERFRCYACGAHGDAIDFTAQLFAEPPAQAVARLAADFALNLPSQTPATPAQQRAWQQAAAEQARAKALADAFAQWDADTYDALSTMHRTLRDWRCDHAPRDPTEPLNLRYCFAIWHIDWLRHLLDIFIDTNAVRIALYQNMTIRKEIYELAKRFDYLVNLAAAERIVELQQYVAARRICARAGCPTDAE